MGTTYDIKTSSFNDGATDTPAAARSQYYDNFTAIEKVSDEGAASSVMKSDANGNTLLNVIDKYTTTATADGTTTLTVASTHTQRFTGILNQNCKAPVTTTLTLGQSYKIVNDSSGIITAQSSGTDEICKVQPGERALITCILLTGTDETSWTVEIIQSESQTTELSQQVSIQSVPTGIVTGGVTDGLISGLTLVNSATTDATDSEAVLDDAVLYLDTSGKLNPTSGSDATFPLASGDVYFTYISLQPDSSEIDEIQSGDGSTATGETTAFTSGLEVYQQVTSGGTTASKLAVVASADGNLKLAKAYFINQTNCGNSTDTVAQMLDKCRGGYFEGMANTKNLAVKSVGKNLWGSKKAALDIFSIINNGAIVTFSNIDSRETLTWVGNFIYVGNTFFTKFIPNTQYTISVYSKTQSGARGGILRVKYTDASVESIITSNSTSWTLNTLTTNASKSVASIESSAVSAGAITYIDYNTLQVEIGSTATDYESFDDELFETECELLSVKNATGLTRDTVDAKGNHIKKIKEPTEILSGGTVNTTTYTDAKSGGYYLVLQDDGIMLNGTVGDTVTTSDAGDVIYELAEPIPTNLFTEGKASGTIKAFKDGTIYQDCTNARERVTSSATPDITLTTAIREIIQLTYKNTDDEIVEISPSDLTLSADGLTITGTTVIPASTLCQVKGYLKYNIPALITGNVAVNLKAVVDSLNEIIGSQSAQITSLQDTQNLILALI